jgi:hypothetical protein
MVGGENLDNFMKCKTWLGSNFMHIEVGKLQLPSHYTRFLLHGISLAE